MEKTCARVCVCVCEGGGGSSTYFWFSTSYFLIQLTVGTVVLFNYYKILWVDKRSPTWQAMFTANDPRMLCSKHYWHIVGFVMSDGISCTEMAAMGKATHFIRHKSWSAVYLRHHVWGYGLQWLVSSRWNCGCHAICAVHTYVYWTRALGDERATSCSAGVMRKERRLRRENHAKDVTYARTGSPMFHCLRWLAEPLAACKGAKIRRLGYLEVIFHSNCIWFWTGDRYLVFL